MFIRRKKSWEISENRATDESAFLNRRQLMKAAGLGAIGAGMGGSAYSIFGMNDASAQVANGNAGLGAIKDLFPAKKNTAYDDIVGREITDEIVNSTYNNFYEFASHKQIWKAAQKLELSPWDVMIDGEVEEPIKIGVEDLIRKMPIEERIYRPRCVEAWAMTVPWTGFAMAELVKFAKPKSGAKYVRMETFQKPDQAPGQRASWNPWPYIEGLTIEEAQNEMAFMVTGAYGKPLAKQFGAPLRLALPWKYGFKHIKSLENLKNHSKHTESF